MSMHAYTKEFYEDQTSGARASAKEVVPLVLELVQATSVIDIGCGIGTWLSVFQECGIQEIYGVDGDHVDRSMLQIPQDRFSPFDLKQPLRIDRQFDLVVSLEVAEHLPSDCTKTFIDSLTSLGPVILFSAAIPFQGGTDHVNEQWPDYWADQFSRKNYVVIDAIRNKIWNNDSVESWYAQNTLIFAREDYLERYPLLKLAFEHTSTSPLSVVHPKMWTQMWTQMEQLRLATEDIAALIPAGDTLILVDEGELDSNVTAGRRTLRFLDGGDSPDSAIEIRELERLHQAGANFIVFAWPAFWWLDYYGRLDRYLRSEFRCLLENDRLVVFDLRS